MKKILFLTGTRADFGKLKSLLQQLETSSSYDVHLFVTGMHMLKKYGHTYEEIDKCGFENVYKFINQNISDTMDSVLAKTVQGFSDFIKENKPDMIVVHGDRVEALAGAIVGSMNNILVSHIEGGEISGTVDGLIRHAITKMSHLHFVANEDAKRRLMQLGEAENTIFVIGSPDMDILASPDLPSLSDVRKRYDVNFPEYSILIYHPVTTEIEHLKEHIKNMVDVVLDDTSKNYIVIYPNNDSGSDYIFHEYERFKGVKNVMMFPSMRFEHFLTLLKNAEFIIGNSSAGVREAPYFGVPCINVGTRQMNRANAATILHSDCSKQGIVASINKAENIERVCEEMFGNGNSDELFLEIVNGTEIWNANTQKYFVDYEAT